MVYEILVVSGHPATGVRGRSLFIAIYAQSEQFYLTLLRSVFVVWTGAVVRGGRARRLRLEQAEQRREYVLVRAGQKPRGVEVVVIVVI